MLDTIANLKQPAPAGNGEDVTALVVSDLKQRSAAGEAKYGMRLKTFNGRSALIDLYQELLDAVVYLRQHIAEESSLTPPGAGETGEERPICGKTADGVTVRIGDAVYRRHHSAARPEQEKWYASPGGCAARVDGFSTELGSFYTTPEAATAAWNETMAKLYPDMYGHLAASGGKEKRT